MQNFQNKVYRNLLYNVIHVWVIQNSFRDTILSIIVFDPIVIQTFRIEYLNSSYSFQTNLQYITQKFFTNFYTLMRSYFDEKIFTSA